MYYQLYLFVENFHFFAKKCFLFFKVIFSLVLFLVKKILHVIFVKTISFTFPLFAVLFLEQQLTRTERKSNCLKTLARGRTLTRCLVGGDTCSSSSPSSPSPDPKLSPDTGSLSRVLTSPSPFLGHNCTYPRSL